MGEEEEGREMLHCFIYSRMAEGKSFRNVNSVSNLESSNEENDNECFVE